MVLIALLLISVTVLSACGTGAAQTQDATTQQEVQQAVELAGSLIENARSLAEFLD